MSDNKAEKTMVALMGSDNAPPDLLMKSQGFEWVIVTKKRARMWQRVSLEMPLILPEGWTPATNGNAPFSATVYWDKLQERYTLKVNIRKPLDKLMKPYRRK